MIKRLQQTAAALLLFCLVLGIFPVQAQVSFLKDLDRYIEKSRLKGEKEKALKSLSDDTEKYTWNDPDFSGFMPGLYALGSSQK